MESYQVYECQNLFLFGECFMGPFWFYMFFLYVCVCVYVSIHFVSFYNDDYTFVWNVSNILLWDGSNDDDDDDDDGVFVTNEWMNE